MKFKDYIYIRPDYENYKTKLNNLVEEFKNSGSFEECDARFIEIDNLRRNIYTMLSVAALRNNINTKDIFYCEELKYWNENKPLYEKLNTNYFKVLVNSQFRKEFELKFRVLR